MPKNRIHSANLGRQINRRRFMRSAAIAGAATFAAPAILRARNLNEKLNIAIIGSGGRGASNMQSVATENIVALCDVNAANLGRAAEAHPSARRYDDFRKLFDHAGDFDAVVVSTCEHAHAFASCKHFFRFGYFDYMRLFND